VWFETESKWGADQGNSRRHRGPGTGKKKKKVTACRRTATSLAWGALPLLYLRPDKVRYGADPQPKKGRATGKMPIGTGLGRSISYPNGQSGKDSIPRPTFVQPSSFHSTD